MEVRNAGNAEANGIYSLAVTVRRDAASGAPMVSPKTSLKWTKQDSESGRTLTLFQCG